VLAQARRQAASERDRFRELLQQVPAVVNFLSGPDLVFEFAHPLTERALGGRPLVGRPLLEAIPEHHGQPFVEMLRRVLTTGEVVSGHERLAWLDRNNTGELQESYWNFMYLPVRSASGEVEGVMTFDLDVTEQVLARKQLEQQTAALARAREDAENASRAKDEFLAMLGHELRNPLAPILTALQLMRLHGSESREQQVIERQVGHLTRLVDDLLDVSRITRGKIELNARPRELADVVAHAMEIASPLLEQRGHHVHVEVPRHGLGVNADLDRLAQVLANLLTNAAKYSDPGSHIWVRASRDGGDVEIRVKDGGIGIAPDMLTRVFEPFIQQTQSLDRSRGGLGLGLAIVRSLVERHGGTVRAESDGPGRGSEFVVRLPAIAIAEEPAPLAETPFETAKVPETRRQRILVVDDNHDAAEMLKYALETLGFVVELAHDGPSALQKAETFHPNIALLDIGLPVMDGYELAVRLRAQRAGGNGLRLIALSGYGQERDRARSMGAGFDAHLVKPIDLGRLEALLQKSKSSAES
jgi:signal transduction histidine kinase/CheY-like chemotaxis protein